MSARGRWNKGKLVGQKAPLKLRDIWAIRVRLEIGDRKRELALFNLALDSKLRGCDLVQLHVRDVAHGDRITAAGVKVAWIADGRLREAEIAAILFEIAGIAA